MPIEREYNVEDNYVLSTHVPPLSMEEQASAVNDATTHPEFRPSMHFVIDHRELSLADYSVYSLEQMRALLEQHVQASQGIPIRIAHVAPADIHEQHFLARLARTAVDLMEGQLTTRLFHELEPAIAWVIEGNALQKADGQDDIRQPRSGHAP